MKFFLVTERQLESLKDIRERVEKAHNAADSCFNDDDYNEADYQAALAEFDDANRDLKFLVEDVEKRILARIKDSGDLAFFVIKATEVPRW